MFLGDVPAPVLWKTVIDTRETLAAVRNAHNIPDSFVVPPGLDRTSDGPNGGNTGNVLASLITAQIMSLPSADIHAVKRANMNAAITAMTNQINQLQSPTGTTTAIAPTIATVPTVDTNSPLIVAPGAPGIATVTPTLPSAVSPSSMVTPAGASSSSNMMLYLLGGAGLLFVLMKGKRSKKGGKRASK